MQRLISTQNRDWIIEDNYDIKMASPHSSVTEDAPNLDVDFESPEFIDEHYLEIIDLFKELSITLLKLIAENTSLRSLHTWINLKFVSYFRKVKADLERRGHVTELIRQLLHAIQVDHFRDQADLSDTSSETTPFPKEITTTADCPISSELCTLPEAEDDHTTVDTDSDFNSDIAALLDQKTIPDKEPEGGATPYPEPKDTQPKFQFTDPQPAVQPDPKRPSSLHTENEAIKKFLQDNLEASRAHRSEPADLAAQFVKDNIEPTPHRRNIPPRYKYTWGPSERTPPSVPPNTRNKPPGIKLLEKKKDQQVIPDTPPRRTSPPRGKTTSPNIIPPSPPRTRARGLRLSLSQERPRPVLLKRVKGKTTVVPRDKTPSPRRRQKPKKK